MTTGPGTGRPEDKSVKLAMSDADARLLYEVLGERPHNEAWSNRVWTDLRFALMDGMADRIEARQAEKRPA